MKEALAIEQATYERLMREIDAGRQAEADYQAALSGDNKLTSVDIDHAIDLLQRITPHEIDERTAHKALFNWLQSLR